MCTLPLAIIYVNRLNFGVRALAEGLGAMISSVCKFELVANRGTLFSFVMCGSKDIVLEREMSFTFLSLLSLSLFLAPTVGMGVIGFSLAQLINSLVLFIVYYGYCALELRHSYFAKSFTDTNQEPGTFFWSISSWLPNPVITKPEANDFQPPRIGTDFQHKTFLLQAQSILKLLPPFLLQSTCKLVITQVSV